MRKLPAFFLTFLAATPIVAKVVVLEQPGFPTIASQPVSRDALAKALDGMEPVFADIRGLRDATTLKDAELLVLPYGSAVPADAWASIAGYLKSGGNLLVLGGQPLRVPVTEAGGKFKQARPQDTYSREAGIRHTYEVPYRDGATFAWRHGYSFLPALEIRARRFFALEGRLDGLGYMVSSSGTEVAGPVVVVDHVSQDDPMRGSRAVMLDFEPEPGYWESPYGITLMREAAEYARQGATSFWIEVLFSTLKPGETAQAVVHLHNVHRQRLGLPVAGEVQVELLTGSSVIETARVACSGSGVDAQVYFQKRLPPGFYSVRGRYEGGGRPREFHQTGFWVEDEKLLTSGPVLGVSGDFLTRDGKPYFPVGTNYFTTEEDGWDFSGPRNAWVWDRDFADMARHGVNFVRTGVWLPDIKFIEPATGTVNERFLRNLEAFLLSARRHGIFVNFTFFAFTPRTIGRPFENTPGPLPNPYLDQAAVRAERDYVLSVVNRFRDVPWLCWDLINEPNFSNPQRLWKGNTPNGDPAEVAAWRNWLREKYSSLAELAAAWSVTPEELGSFDSVPLPGEADLAFSRYGNPRQVRAVDYNLFAQDAFSGWVRTMVAAIRSTGSQQLIDVGQDEGGVADRVLNLFYANAGVAFTTNHTYWRDDALLWDSLAAKRSGMPNITGETGYQPVWSADGTWRYDEITGYPLLERKWALGFAAGSSGVLTWQWAREPDFGMKRSDGSAKIWQDMLGGISAFAEKAAPWATGIAAPQTAIVLPQSYQLSVANRYALEAQQTAVRALYHYARSEAYVVGEYQIELLGDPKLIILPSPFALTAHAWDAIRAKVEAGATLLISGLFDDDPHLHPTGRAQEVGLAYEHGPLTIREHLFRWPGGEARLAYGGEKTTFLERAVLPDGGTWAEKTLGKGRILFSPLPLELNDNTQAVGAVYRYALKAAGVAPTYTAGAGDPGILIAPTRFPHATLYVLTSESDQAEVTFRDQASGKEFNGTLEPGRAALLLIGEDGAVLASYNWKNR
jgi:hypothetical protein